MPRFCNDVPNLIPFYDVPLQSYGDFCPHILDINRRNLSPIPEEKAEESHPNYESTLCCDIYNENIFETSRTPQDINEGKWELPPQAPKEFKNRGTIICHQNMNSIRNKFDEIKSLLQYDRIAVLVCTESKLDTDRDHDCMFMVTGYHMIRRDRLDDQGGGTIIYISEKYETEIVDFETSNKRIEILIVKIRCKGISPILIVSVYRPPNTCMKEFLSIFSELNRKLSLEKCEKIMLGDFNIDILKHVHSEFNQNTHDFCMICQANGWWQMMSGPTHVRGGLLDHFYVNKKHLYSACGQFTHAGSDHNLCFAVRKKCKVKVPPKILEYRFLKKVPWEEVKKELLTKSISDFESETNLDEYLVRNVDRKFSQVNSSVLEIIDKYAPLKKRLVKGKISPWFTSEVRELILVRDRHRSNMLLSNNESNRKEYNRARNQVNNKLAVLKKSYFKSKFAESCKSENMWNTIDQITNFRRKNKQPISYLEVGKRRVYEKDEVYDIFANELTVKPDPSIDCLSVKQEIVKYRENFDYADSKKCDLEPIQVTHEEVYRALSSVKSKKSHNPPNIVPAKIMKACGVVFLGILVRLFTLIVNNKSVPSLFKKALVCPLYKGKGSTKIAGNYRPISLLIDFCKIFEKFLAVRLQVRVESQLSKYQHAYRSDRSCHTALNILINDVYTDIDKSKQKVGAIFIDLRKAFDSVDHNLFILKLMMEYKLEPWYVELIYNNFNSRVFSFEHKGKCFSFLRGICQGSAKGPLAFSMFINGLSSVISICKHLLYADDVVLYASGKSIQEINEKLNKDMESIVNWCSVNKVSINVEKTKVMYFHKAHDSSIKSEFVPEIKIGAEKIERVFEFKYLGLNLDPCLTFDNHYVTICKKVSGRLKYLRGIKRFLPANIMRIMLYAYVLSVTDYAIDIWAVVAESKLEKLQRMIDNFLYEFEYPTLMRSKRRRLLEEINFPKIRKKYNLLTISQRRDFVLMKGMCKKFVNKDLNLSNRLYARKTPLVKLRNFNSVLYKSSPDHRGTLLWNQVPREVELKESNINVFLEKFKQDLLDKN